MTNNTLNKKAALAELVKLTKANGGTITPEILVEAATDAENPLHQYFEWDDTRAAHKFRLMQARTLIRSCKIHYTVNHRKVSIPKYVRNPEAEAQEQGYVETARVRNESDLAREVLLKEFDRIAGALRRARHLGHYFEMTDEIDNMTEAFGLMRKRIDETGDTLNA